jgi:hypothetical protein
MINSLRRLLLAASAVGIALTAAFTGAAPASADTGPYTYSNNGYTVFFHTPITFGLYDQVVTDTTRLFMQADGNLVLYCQANDQAVWSTRTWNYPYSPNGTHATFQDDGNFVVYTYSAPVWASNTWGHSGAALAVQRDNNIVIYDVNGRPLWSSNTWHACPTY